MFDHEVKLRRAYEHLEWISAYLKPWFEGHKHTEMTEPDPQVPGNVRLMATLTQEPVTYPLTVILGECLHNLRSALDILAYEVTESNAKPFTEKLAQDSLFVIQGDEDGHGVPGRGPKLFKEARRRYAGWPDKAKAELQRLQPYNRGTDFRSDPLWKLNELDRISKHRLLHVVTVAGGTGMKVEPGNAPYDPVADWPFRPGILKGEDATLRLNTATNVGSFPLRTDLRPEQMKVKPTAIVSVVIENVAVPGIHTQRPPVVETLAEAHNHILSEVVPALTTFL